MYILLHFNDAKSLGVLTGDRVVISSPSSGKVTADYVETTTTLIEQGRIGVYHHTNELLELTEGGVKISTLCKSVGVYTPASVYILFSSI